jgi:hypothetical protein
LHSKEVLNENSYSALSVLNLNENWVHRDTLTCANIHHRIRALKEILWSGRHTVDCCGKPVERRVGLSGGGRKETAIR